MKIRLVFVAILFQHLILPSVGRALEVPAGWKFKTITTPHFDVIYNAEQQELGELYARQMERAYALTSPIFTAMPEKTLVIINDKTDATNGYATRIPYPHIMTYPVLPGPQESLAESGDWSLELLIHEYTHILTFEPATGVFKTLRGIFGSIAAPNLLLPSWWKEGIAVQVESSITENGGRAKSLYQDAIIRAFVEEKTFLGFGVDQANEYIPTWPEGSRPYLFGSIFWSQSVDDYGNEVMNDLNQRHSSRAPYFISAPAEDLLHDSYRDAYDKAMMETRYRALRQISTLKEVALTEMRPLPIQAKYSSAPAISDDGKYMAMLTVDYKADRVLDIYERDPTTMMITKKLKVEIKKQEDPVVPGEKQDGPPSGSIQRISWFHKSPKIVYDRLHFVNRIERYSDLNVYDLATGKTKEISHSLRAREPSVSPSDEKIVFVKLEGSRTHLGLLDIATQKAQLLYSPEIQARISHPTFLDTDRIVFAFRSPSGEEHLRVYNFQNKSVTSLFPDFKQSRFPSVTPRGLMFTAANSGVHNLYLASADLKTARPISHVLSMISTAAMDPETQTVYATSMTAAGPIVKRIEKVAWEQTPTQLPRIERIFADRYQELLKPAEPAVDATQFQTKDYSPAQYLWPQYWIPFIWSSPEGGVEIQIMTSGFDPLKKHAYDVMAAWNTYLNAADWSVGYLNNVTKVPIQFSAAQLHSYLVTRDNLVDDTLVSLSALPDTYWISEKIGTEFGWRYLQRSVGSTPSTKRTGPYATIVYRNMSQGGEQFTPQEGGGAYLSGTNYIEGNDLMPHSQMQTGGVYYFSKFLPKLHSIFMRASVLYTPEKLSYIYGTQSASMDYVGNDFASKFLSRGYSTGQFIGRNMYSGSLEYRFPVRDFYKGPGTTPLFFRRLWGSVVADAIATDGIAYDINTQKRDNIDASQVFWGFGAEAHFETTLGYELPVTFVLGIYKGTDKKYAPDPTSALAIQFAGF